MNLHFGRCAMNYLWIFRINTTVAVSFSTRTGLIRFFVRACAVGHDHAVPIPQSGDDDDRGDDERGVIPQQAAQFEPGRLGHRQIEDDEIGADPARLLQYLVAFIDGKQLVSFSRNMLSSRRVAFSSSSTIKILVIRPSRNIPVCFFLELYPPDLSKANSTPPCNSRFLW